MHNKFRSKWRALLALGGALALIGVFAVQAQAAFDPDDPTGPTHYYGTFYFCNNNTTGAMRMVSATGGDARGKCTAAEKRVRFYSAGTPLGTGATGPKGEKGNQGDKGNPGEDGAPGLAALESDGPYPGATDLGDMEGQGDNSDAKVAAGSRATVWVKCAPGKLALGGGFRVAADSTLEAAKAIHVIASEPAQINPDGELVYAPISGDEAGSIQPNGWAVDVVNDGDTDQVVRPWVVCAKTAEPPAPLP